MLKVTAADWRNIFPRAPQAVIDAFVKDNQALADAGILDTKRRFSWCMANVEHECGGFAIPRLTENINYSAERMASVWPNRFGKPAATVGKAAVQRKYGTAPGWQKKAFDDIYGSRMGNRPGTHDGSTYIGRGGPQVTGLDGYAEVGKRSGLDLVNHPELAGVYENQPKIIAAFWSWKNMNHFADRNDWKGAVRAWNGGTNGIADREALMRGNDPIIARLNIVNSVEPHLETLTS